jgi:hypothetical protein
MADISITAANVVPDAGYSFVEGSAGEALTAGLVVYQKASDSKYWIAHCETSLATAAAVGIALHGAAANQPIRVMTAGTITIGGTVAIGTIYLLSASGGIMPMGDIATADWITKLGIGTTAAKISVRVHQSGVQKAA